MYAQCVDGCDVSSERYESISEVIGKRRQLVAGVGDGTWMWIVDVGSSKSSSPMYELDGKVNLFRYL